MPGLGVEKNCLFPVTVRKEIGKVGQIQIVQNCMFYACFLMIGSGTTEKNFRVGIFFE